MEAGSGLTTELIVLDLYKGILPFRKQMDVIWEQHG